MVERKASEILLEVEQRLKAIETLLKLQEFQNRLIIDNFNKLLRQNLQQDIRVATQADIMPALPQAAENPNNSKKLMKIDFSSPVPSNLKPLLDTDLKSIDINDGVSMLNPEIKIPVTQKIIMFDGNPMSQAKITIKDDKKNFVKRVDSSMNGRWQVVLPPGKYSAHICGKHLGNTLEATQPFEVPIMSSPLELPPPQAFKRKPI